MLPKPRQNRVSNKKNLNSIFSLLGADTGLTVGGKYALDGSTYVKAKLDHKLNLGVSYSQAFGAGVQATLSARVNGKALDQGGHQVGLMLNFDA